MNADNAPNPSRVTVAVLSWNRLHYLRATLESARRCIQYPDIEWIVSDNASEEPGLREYLASQEWVNVKIVKRQSHAEAMNEIVARASGAYLLLWPDDVQFVVEGPWMRECVDVLRANADIGSLMLDGLRRSTVHTLLSPPRGQAGVRLLKELYWYRGRVRWPHEIVSVGGSRFRTLGWTQTGIGPAGIPSLTRTAVWRELGPWRTSGGPATNLVDSSGGAEDNMLIRFHASRLRLQLAMPFLPVAADIITDPTGCKAKVRGRYRYGVYMPAQSADGLYYEIRNIGDFATAAIAEPLSFADVVKPIGFRIPTDTKGDRLKSSINTSVVFDVLNNQEVKYPLLPPPQ